MLSFVEGAGYVDNETKICEKKNIPSRKLTGIPPGEVWKNHHRLKMDALQGIMYPFPRRQIPNIESSFRKWLLLPCPSGDFQISSVNELLRYKGGGVAFWQASKFNKHRSSVVGHH